MSGPTPEQWRKIFLECDPGQDSGERFLPSRSCRNLTSAEHFARYLFASGFCAGKRVLDVACGAGYGSYILKILGAAHVVGLDSDAVAVALARRNYQAAGLEFRAGDATAWEAPDAPFDVIVSFETLEHVSDPEVLLKNLRRQLAPQGLFLISCPHDARSPWPSPFHLRHYTYHEFRDLVGRYFPEIYPFAQIHAVASLILPPEAAAADELAALPLPEAYFDVAKSIESSDAFVLLCGPRSAAARGSAAVISKNLTEFLQEIYAGVNYVREHVPHLKWQLAEAKAQIDRQARQLRARSRALEDQKKYTLELLEQLEAMRCSRTWRAMLACREAVVSLARFSPGKLFALPFRLGRILTGPPMPPAPAGADTALTTAPILPQYLPHRRSEIRAWPAERPLITVGIPCYNYGRFLREAIDSVLASTFQDFEIIVVNDGSTEPETLAVLEDLERNPPAGARLRVVHQENQGLAAARNKGAALGLGKYVVSLDADDRIDPTYLEKVAWVLENQPQYGFCYSLVQRFGAENTIWKTEPFSLEKALRYNHVPTGAAFRREAWVEAGGFRNELRGQDDWNFWITLGAKGWDGYLIEEPLFFYRTHPTSMWSNIQISDREKTAEKIRALNSYLIGQGDSRAAEEFQPPQDPVVRAAIDQPEPPPRPGVPLARRPHLKFGDGRPALLFAIPWMQIGGAEQVVLQVMQGLAGNYALAAVTTLDVEHNWEAEFARLTPWIYHLAHLPLEDPQTYLRELISLHGISGLVISSSALAYEAVPFLKQDGDLWTADIVHNTVAEGYFESSRRADRYLDCHFAVGRPQRDALITRGGIRPEKIRLAPTAVDAALRFNPSTYAARLPEIRHSLGIKGGETILTYTGRLAIEKDVPLFVRVVGELVRRHPQKRFQAFILGDGPERARVEHEIQLQGLQGVIELLGFCDNVPEILAASHFALLTSRFEGSSITLLEAMSMRQIVLSTEAGSVRDVITDGVNGFIISSRSPAEFAGRILEVLGNPSREAEIRERARQTIIEHYDLASMVRVYAETIREALAERRDAAVRPA